MTIKPLTGLTRNPSCRDHCADEVLRVADAIRLPSFGPTNASTIGTEIIAGEQTVIERTARSAGGAVNDNGHEPLLASELCSTAC
ncbi:hypothetical protein LNAOJCKE_2367 [Methylorubrum aminovorans]|uniref:Uncharacterized protein n=1 Tax=Methylorubrum aminovorans TaxID=269069 RepID=A0ABQ4UEB9_9HYPH|nr:hypothetical protein [Methylorubrum aminovorans]GJE65157.1 hypothetical protein LNAOJCKE_2367 [Methylorubrum aminovorans]